MEIPKQYDPNQVEDKWYQFWLDNEVFTSTPDDRESFTVVIPPPNVTGVLHMGHMLNNTIQDVLVRRARMAGKNACWVPGTDHASIATEAKVVDKLQKDGIDKATLTREQFLEHAWEWTHKHGGIILEQLKKLGASCDWSRTDFTMNDNYSSQVIKVFVDLYNKGLIYRGVRMINWDPQAQTALSDEEVNHKEVNSKLYHIHYTIKETGEKVTVATTRPETLLGDTAVCVNPNDERYKHLHGKTAIVPLVDREVPVILDEYVDLEFGTGVLKVTPAHDENDYKLGIKHNLEVIDIFHDNGHLNELAGKYDGLERFKARKTVAADLEELGLLAKVEELKNKVGYSERTDAVIEPKLSLQWFCKMDDLSKPALENVMNDTVNFVPAKFKNTYKHWMENIRDWCISRQLWWGHQIPAYFYGKGPNDFVVAETKEAAVKLASEKLGKAVTADELSQDEDVMDTWFSSWLWPIAVFDGINNPENEEINYYYPTNDLVTAPEIMFFWVARMVIAGYEYRGKQPFSNVYYTGIVRDKQRRKMSKSLGNSPDPIELMKQYGADGVRIGMLMCSSAGNDILFDEKLCEQGRNFTNKLWNAFRLVQSWEVSEEAQPESSKQAIAWFKEKLKDTQIQIEDHYSKYRLSDVAMACYKLVFDDFCNYFLEGIKPDYGKPVDKASFDQTIEFFKVVVQTIHPVTPFISEEVWSYIKSENDACLAEKEGDQLPTETTTLIAGFDKVAEAVGAIRNFRNKQQMAKHEAIDLHLTIEGNFTNELDELLKKLGVIDNYIKGPVEGSHQTFMVGTAEFAIPVQLDESKMGAQKDKLEEELKYAKGFLSSVDKKLSNSRFVDNAPEAVVAKERQKRDDAAAKIKALEEQLAAMV